MTEPEKQLNNPEIFHFLAVFPQILSTKPEILIVNPQKQLIFFQNSI
jgi:hypothetical protein